MANTTRNINKLRDQELAKNITGDASWHSDFKDSAYIFVGNLNYLMSEGDVAIVFSQWGELVDVHLVRDKKTGKSRGFAFIAYEDQRSTVLAVDNFNGIDLCGRTIRVDHVKKFRPPKELLDIKEEGIDIFDHLYKPSGPDGKGWGPFRDKDVQEEAVIQEQEQLEQLQRQRNEKILKNIEEIKNKEIILDEDERWEKLLMKELETDLMKEKIEQLQKQNIKIQKKIKKDKIKKKKKREGQQ